jgi:hypothetical protein
METHRDRDRVDVDNDAGERPSRRDSFFQHGC